MKRKSPKCMGWREWVSLPELGVEAIKAKVDSGARTSALHAEDIRIFRRVKSGTRVARFLIRPQKGEAEPLRVQAPYVGKRMVRSSVGHETIRPVIRTTLKVGRESWPIEITLVNRDIMGFRMLLGRSAIRHGFLIDPAHSYLMTKARRRLKK